MANTATNTAEKPAKNDSQQPRGHSGTLNVLLHGTFAFIQDEKQIQAHIPQLDHHVARAGNWLAETELRPGRYELKGTDERGRAKLDPEKNLIVTSEFIPVTKERRKEILYATLTLPRPQTITSLRVAGLPKGSLKPGNEKPEHVATLQIFTYKFENDAELRLSLADEVGQNLLAHYWEPVFTTGDYINLHVFSAENHPHDPDHAKQAFAVIMELLGSDLKLERPHPAGGATETDLPLGVIPEETEDLMPRTLRMARLGRLFKQNGDLNLAWFGNEALDSDPNACGSGGR